MSVNKQSSKQLQQFFPTCSSEIVDSILQELQDDLIFMTTDNYSNYSLSSLFKSCTSLQRLFIINIIKDGMHIIARNKKGTHCLQNLISLIETKEEE